MIMYIEEEIREIGFVVCQNRDRLERIEAMLKDLLADNKPKDRQGKEKAIKDTLLKNNNVNPESS